MTSKVFAIHDSKAAAFASPFFMATKGQAIRAFTDLARDPQSMVGKHPIDYCLFYLSEYDDSLGSFVNLKAPENMGLASDFLAASEVR